MRVHLCTGLLAAIGLTLVASAGPANVDEAYLTWTAKQAKSIGESMRAKGRAKPGFLKAVLVGRGLQTERARSYELRATWMTPETIRATARLLQIRNRYTREETEAFVKEAEGVADTVVLIELDPDEGSGVIPRGWLAILQPKGLEAEQPGGVRGTVSPRLRKVKALAGVRKRDYDYDRFWVTFPLLDEEGNILLDDSVQEAELLVLITATGGRVRWRIPESIRARARQLQAERQSVAEESH